MGDGFKPLASGVLLNARQIIKKHLRVDLERHRAIKHGAGFDAKADIFFGFNAHELPHHLNKDPLRIALRARRPAVDCWGRWRGQPKIKGKHSGNSGIKKEPGVARKTAAINLRERNFYRNSGNIT